MKQLPSTILKCPSCGMPFDIGESVAITWDEAKKAYKVEANISCRQCPAAIQEVGKLPVLVAAESRCSCGKILKLASNRLRRDGDDVLFTGTYQCPSCRRSVPAMFRFVGKMIRSIWSNTKKIRVDATGVEYEKKSA